MVTFGFRLRFQVPLGYSFRGVRSTRRIRLPGLVGCVHLKKLNRPRRFSFTHRPEYVLLGSQFPSRGHARECGFRLKRALLLFAAKNRIGFETGKDRATSSLSTAARNAIAAQHAIQVRDDVLGVDVFAEEPQPKWIRISATGTVSHVIVDYEHPLVDFYKQEFVWTAKQQLALELYNLSHFEGAPKVRFLSLITVAEVLAKRPKRSDPVCMLIEQMLTLVRTADGISENEKLRLSDGIGNLKRESISGACRDLIAAYGTADDAEYFARCYSARGKMVHEGDPNDPLDLTRLDQLVSHVLVANLMGTANSTH